MGRALVGRAEELAALDVSIHGLRSGAGSIVLLEGEPGIGKTRLVDEAVEHASDAGLRVWRGACGQLSREIPFAPIVDALAGAEQRDRPPISAVASLLEAEPPAGESAGRQRARLLHALAGSIEDECDPHGLVFAVEDVQWADPSTLALLERLIRRSAHVPLLLLLTMRPYPVGAALGALLCSLDSVDHRHLVLAPLADDEVRQLVEETLGATAGPTLLRAVAGAAGNPLFVAEVLATLQDESELVVADGTVDAATAEQFESLRLAILRRLGFLPRKCIDVLRIAAILGETFEIEELAVVTEISATRLIELLEAALATKVLHEAESRLAFRHELVREAIYNDRPLAIRQALHDDAARKLRDAGYPAAKIVPHLLRGTARSDSESVAIARTAARDYVFHDPGMAVEILERAVGLIPAGDPVREEVTAELATALIWAGRWADGERIARHLADARRRPQLPARVLGSVVEASWLRGVVPERVASAIEEAAHSAHLPASDRKRLLQQAALAAVLNGDLSRGRALATEALEAAGAAGDDLARSEALCLLSQVAWHEGRPADGAAAAERAAALVSGLSSRVAGDAQVPFLLLVMNLALLQRYEDALAAFREGAERAERTGNVWVLAQLHQAGGMSQFYAGNLDAAEGEFEASLRLWQDLDAGAWAATQRAWLGRIAVHRGDLSRARRELAIVDVEVPPGTTWSPARNVAVASLTRALLREAEGDIGAAFAALEDARHAVASAGASVFGLRIGPGHVRVALAAGHVPAAAAMAEAVEDVAQTVDTPAARGQATRCRGLLSGDSDLLLEAVRLHREGPGRIDLAEAAEDAAAALARTGARGDATGMLYEALDIWESAGATQDAARVLAALRALGARPGKRGPRRRAETGWESLTDSERRVVDLVGEGLTYREIGERLFISRRTVETHVARVFGKVGVRSRAELAALLIEGQAEATRSGDRR